MKIQECLITLKQILPHLACHLLKTLVWSDQEMFWCPVFVYLHNLACFQQLLDRANKTFPGQGMLSCLDIYTDLLLHKPNLGSITRPARHYSSNTCCQSSENINKQDQRSIAITLVSVIPLVNKSINQSKRQSDNPSVSQSVNQLINPLGNQKLKFDKDLI